MSVKELLEQEIKENLEAMGNMAAINSVEYRDAANNTAKLIEKLTEMERLELEHQDKKQSRQEENDLKLKQMNDDKKDRLIKNVLTGVNVVGGLALTVWGTITCIEFEKTGTITTVPGREHLKKLFSKR